MLDAYTRTGGCRDQIDECQAVASVYDPDNIGTNATVNQICADAETFCSENLRAPFHEISGRNYYDFTQVDPDPFPYEFFVGWLNQPVMPSFNILHLPDCSRRRLGVPHLLSSSFCLRESNQPCGFVKDTIN